MCQLSIILTQNAVMYVLNDYPGIHQYVSPLVTVLNVMCMLFVHFLVHECTYVACVQVFMPVYVILVMHMCVLH